MPKLRTKIQNSKMFGLAAKIGVSHDDLRDYAFEVSAERTDHTSELFINEADVIIARLEKVAQPQPNWSPRTVQYRRRKAGVEAIVSRAHLDKLQRLADGRGMSSEGLRALCGRMLRDASGNPMEKPRTTAECNKIIEAIKAMNKRKRVFGAFKQEAA